VGSNPTLSAQTTGGGFPIWIAVLIGVLVLFRLGMLFARPWGGRRGYRRDVIVEREAAPPPP